MGTEAATDYQRLGEQLDQAAETLRRTRGKSARKSAPSAAQQSVSLSSAQAETAPSPQPADPISPATPEVAPVLATSNESDLPETQTSEAADLPADGPVPDAEETPNPQLFPDARPAPSLDLAALEALLFSTRHPLTSQRLAELIDVPSAKALRQAVAELNRQYESGGRAFRIEQVAGGYQMLTLPVYGTLLNKLYQREVDAKLSRSALETLSIIAYKQPVLRADVEAIRGVASGETIRNLMEKHLVKIAGRAEIPGRPILYGTTKRFLEVFGLNSLKELPQQEAAPKSSPKPEAKSTPSPEAEPPAQAPTAEAQAPAPQDVPALQ